ncbi:MAG TPA: hypothetical protein VJY39_23795 [Acidisphaera sp.]|nr:hypothetical protein [Acidisphaera sp.]
MNAPTVFTWITHYGGVSISMPAFMNRRSKLADRRRAPLLLLAACLSAGSPAHAQTCSVEQATASVEEDVIERGGRSAAESMAIIQALERITHEAQKPGVPLSRQLNSVDAARFTELSQKLQSIRVGQLIESARARDARVVAGMYAAAWAAYGNPSYVPADGDVPGATLLVLRVLRPQPEIPNIPQSSSCSVDSALDAVERETLARIQSFDATTRRSLDVINQERQKYNLPANGSIDPSKLRPDDARTLQRAQSEMQPAFAEAQLAYDAANIISWWDISKHVYRSWLEDIETYGADPGSMGKTLDREMASFDQQQKALLGIWIKIDERMPSDAEKQNAALANALRSNGGAGRN